MVDENYRDQGGRLLAQKLMDVLGRNVYESGNFIVTDSRQGFLINFVSDGFCQLTGGGCLRCCIKF